MMGDASGRAGRVTLVFRLGVPTVALALALASEMIEVTNEESMICTKGVTFVGRLVSRVGERRRNAHRSRPCAGAVDDATSSLVCVVQYKKRVGSRGLGLAQSHMLIRGGKGGSHRRGWNGVVQTLCSEMKCPTATYVRTRRASTLNPVWLVLLRLFLTLRPRRTAWARAARTVPCCTSLILLAFVDTLNCEAICFYAVDVP